MKNLFKKFKQDIVATILTGMAIFIGLSLYSFNPLDPSLNSIGQSIKVTNYCGVVGSFLSDLLFQGFGLGSWFIVLTLLSAAISVFRGKEFNVKNTKIVLGFIIVLVVSALMMVYLPQKKIFQGQIYVGGIVGLASSNTLLKAFNFVGTQVILWAALSMLMVFYFEKTLKDIFYYPRKYFQAFLSYIGKQMSKAVTSAKASSKETIANKTFDKLFESNKNENTKQKQFTLNRPEPPATNSFKMEKEVIVDEDEKKSMQLDLSSQDGHDSKDEMADSEDMEIRPYSSGTKRKIILKQMPKRIENWQMPKLDLLDDPPQSRIRVDEKEIKRKAEVLTDKLAQFDIEGQIVGVKPGPAVTMFEFKPNADVKLSKITELADDLSLALSSESLRIIAPIPGRDVVGIETSNSQREAVYVKDLITEDSFWNEEMKLPITLGRQANGEPKIVDLRKMPHLLVAGTTGSGKSVFTVSSISGLLFKHSPKTLRLILVDPKQVDLAAFSHVPHLIMPPVNEPKKAVSALRWAIREMEKRYRSMKKFSARGIEGFNEVVAKLSADQMAEHEKINNDLEMQAKKLDQYYYTPQPYIVIVVEEFGDLMAVDKQNVEQAVVRLAQMARACGIHLMLAMQSPRKEVVTGLIKTNIPGRISFKVASKMDSRIILDDGGAERLLAQGDMLFLSPGISKPMRHHGPFLKESEIARVAKFWSDQAEPEFDTTALKMLEGSTSSEGVSASAGDAYGEDEIKDERYDEILAWAAEQKEVSASLIQRRFRLGYPRAARLIEIFEKEGVVGPANGSKGRQVLVNSLRET